MHFLYRYLDALDKTVHRSDCILPSENRQHYCRSTERRCVFIANIDSAGHSSLFRPVSMKNILFDIKISTDQFAENQLQSYSLVIVVH